MIAYWQTSGKSKKAYCTENGINEVNFYYWFSRIKENNNVSGSFITIDKAIINNDK
ncbi:IS66 family insertion sequence element accessory protein TnpA [Sphingobacterium sp. UBA7625]|uniref:IS66 family insertion sequence element accessory protein TnpA n=1 Tax=Sphingobacterium TaxID=28453 RepID=UPI0039C95897